MKKYLVMLGTSTETMGGISAVVNEYIAAGLFRRFPLLYIATHRDGTTLRKAVSFVSAWCRYIGLLLTGRVGLIHVHVASDASFWRKSFFILPSILARRRSILHLHGAQFDRFYNETCGGLARHFVRFVFNHVDAVIVLSASWERWACANFRRARVVCIANPVRLAPPETEPRDAATVLFLGRLGERKGTYDLVEAVAGLVGRYPNLKLLLGGDGEHERVTAAVRQLGLESNVEVLGWVTGGKKAELLNRAAVYVLPSYAEGLPVSVLEAMAAGLPVVASSVGGIPELVDHGITGCLIQPGDVEALRDALSKLLADGRLRTEMGVAGRNRIEQAYSIDRVMPHIEKLYNELGVRA